MSDTNTADILVRYVRNADDTHGTEVIKFNDDDRPDLLIGGVGYVTAAELHSAAAFGAVLEQVTPDDVAELGLELPEPDEEPEVISKDLGRDRLEEIASEEGVDLTGKRSNQEKADAILEARAAQPVGAASLPATASTSTSIPAPDGVLAGSGTTDSSSSTSPDGAAS